MRKKHKIIRKRKQNANNDVDGEKKALKDGSSRLDASGGCGQSNNYQVENNKCQGVDGEEKARENLDSNRMESVQKENGSEVQQSQKMEEEDLSGYKIIKPLYMDLKEVGGLEPQIRTRLKQQHSHLAEYIFMTQRQKSKYFHQKNLRYNSIMQKGGSMPARKISFKRNFQVKHFRKEEEPATVRKVKSYRDKYNDKIHYS